MAHMSSEETRAPDCGWMRFLGSVDRTFATQQIARSTRSLVWTIMACPKIELSIVQ